MEVLYIGGLLLAIMLVLLSGGVWIAMTLAICGWVGQAFFTSTAPGKNLFSAFWESNASWELAALPLFIWMGEILFRTKLSEQMFEGLRPWLNRVPGRLMHTTILGCGIFGSVSGSSAATCATISKVALPELLKRGYNEKIALGSLATAGTLGILIPPSITMVVYAVAADASIIRIFLAGFIPGFILMLLFSGYIGIWSLRNPDKVPAAVRAQLAQARAALPGVDKMVAMREELRQLWLNTSVSREQLTADLQAWCRRAEDSGVAALREFSLRLRTARA